jgi:hypothetical protein
MPYLVTPRWGKPNASTAVASGRTARVAAAASMVHLHLAAGVPPVSNRVAKGHQAGARNHQHHVPLPDMTRFNAMLNAASARDRRRRPTTGYMPPPPFVPHPLQQYGFNLENTAQGTGIEREASPGATPGVMDRINSILERMSKDRTSSSRLLRKLARMMGISVRQARQWYGANGGNNNNGQGPGGGGGQGPGGGGQPPGNNFNFHVPVGVGVGLGGAAAAAAQAAQGQGQVPQLQAQPVQQQQEDDDIEIDLDDDDDEAHDFHGGGNNDGDDDPPDDGGGGGGGQVVPREATLTEEDLETEYYTAMGYGGTADAAGPSTATSVPRVTNNIQNNYYMNGAGPAPYMSRPVEDPYLGQEMEDANDEAGWSNWIAGGLGAAAAAGTLYAGYRGSRAAYNAYGSAVNMFDNVRQAPGRAVAGAIQAHNELRDDTRDGGRMGWGGRMDNQVTVGGFGGMETGFTDLGSYTPSAASTVSTQFTEAPENPGILQTIRNRMWGASTVEDPDVVVNMNSLQGAVHPSSSAIGQGQLSRGSSESTRTELDYAGRDVSGSAGVAYPDDAAYVAQNQRSDGALANLRRAGSGVTGWTDAQYAAQDAEQAERRRRIMDAQRARQATSGPGRPSRLGPFRSRG